MELLEKHFEIALETPDGIKKLRELILSLAMQGKLVPQDPNDQHANKLLMDIENEKRRLVKEGKIKKLEPFVPIKQEEIPYELPICWEWIRFKNLAVFINGDRGKNYPSKEAYEPTGVPFINAGHLINGRVDITNMNYINEERYNLLNSGKIQQDDILYCLRGSLGKAAIVKNIKKGAIASSLIIVRLFMKQMAEYCYYYLISPFGQKMILDYDNGSAQPNLSANSIQKYLIPVPSLSEQKRIIDKINQLMALCDKLEAERDERNSKKLKVHAASINKLLTASDKPEFQKFWNFITKNFSELYSVPENVEELKKAILQLAVMGKLVPQDPKDQPASELLFKVKKLKDNLRNKSLKESIQFIKPEAIPYNLPKSWVWCTIENVSYKVTDGEHITPRRVDAGYYLLSARNITNAGITLKDVDYVPYDEYERIRKRCNPEIGDILISCSGSVGRVAVVDYNEYVMVRSVALIKHEHKMLNSQFFAYTLRSEIVQQQILQKSKTTAQSNLFIGKIKEILIPLPPIEEQKRIVAKIDQLMGLCDTLQQQLNDSTKKKKSILNGVLKKY